MCDDEFLFLSRIIFKDNDTYILFITMDLFELLQKYVNILLTNSSKFRPGISLRVFCDKMSLIVRANN